MAKREVVRLDKCPHGSYKLKVEGRVGWFAEKDYLKIKSGVKPVKKGTEEDEDDETTREELFD